MPSPRNTICPAETSPITSVSTDAGYYMKTYTLPSGVTISAVPPLPTLQENKSFNYNGSVIKADGTVDSAALNAFVTTFLGQASPPSTLSSPSSVNQSQEFATKSNTLRNSMRAEYCWYYNRYFWALSQILTKASQSGQVIDPELKVNTAILNSKLNGILLVMKATINSRMNQLNGYYSGGDVNSQNSQLNTARQRLAEDSKILQNNDLQSDVQSAMIQYSIEKNSSSRNLLAIYGFMNIVAVGLLFYLYTHTK
jgi:hypothetical protein